MLRRGFVKSLAALVVSMSKVGAVASMLVSRGRTWETVMDDTPRHGMIIEATIEIDRDMLKDILFCRTDGPINKAVTYVRRQVL